MSAQRMANTTLKNALRQAGLTPEEFADIVRVDPKTVQRWVAGTTTPYPRHRATIARALDLAEHQLWPEHVAAPAGTGEHDQDTDTEVTGSWAYDTDVAAPDPIAFLSHTDGQIDFLDNDRGMLLNPDLARALAEHAAAGRQVRILACLPNRRLEALVGHPNIEIRVIGGDPDHSVLRAGDAMLLTFNLPFEGHQRPPLLKLQRATNAGLFDRLADNLDTIADNAEQTITASEQLDPYLPDYDDEDEDDWGDRLEHSREPVDKPPDPAGPAGQPGTSGRVQQPRRWPRRPN